MAEGAEEEARVEEERAEDVGPVEEAVEDGGEGREGKGRGHSGTRRRYSTERNAKGASNGEPGCANGDFGSSITPTAHSVRKRGLLLSFAMDRPTPGGSPNKGNLSAFLQTEQKLEAYGKQSAQKQKKNKMSEPWEHLQEVVQWKDGDLCAVCMGRPVECSLSPCGHRCVCLECYKSEFGGGVAVHCPVCMRPVEQISRDEHDERVGDDEYDSGTEDDVHAMERKERKRRRRVRELTVLDPTEARSHRRRLLAKTAVVSDGDVFDTDVAELTKVFGVGVGLLFRVTQSMLAVTTALAFSGVLVGVVYASGIASVRHGSAMRVSLGNCGTTPCHSRLLPVVVDLGMMLGVVIYQAWLRWSFWNVRNTCEDAVTAPARSSLMVTGLASDAYKHIGQIKSYFNHCSDDAVLDIVVCPTRWCDILWLLKDRRRMKEDLVMAEAMFAAREKTLSPMDKCLCSDKFRAHFKALEMDDALDRNKELMELLGDKPSREALRRAVAGVKGGSSGSGGGGGGGGAKGVTPGKGISPKLQKLWQAGEGLWKAVRPRSSLRDTGSVAFVTFRNPGARGRAVRQLIGVGCKGWCIALFAWWARFLGFDVALPMRGGILPSSRSLWLFEGGAVFPHNVVWDHLRSVHLPWTRDGHLESWVADTVRFILPPVAMIVCVAVTNSIVVQMTDPPVNPKVSAWEGVGPSLARAFVVFLANRVMRMVIYGLVAMERSPLRTRAQTRQVRLATIGCILNSTVVLLAGNSYAATFQPPMWYFQRGEAIVWLTLFEAIAAARTWVRVVVNRTVRRMTLQNAVCQVDLLRRVVPEPMWLDSMYARTERGQREGQREGDRGKEQRGITRLIIYECTCVTCIIKTRHY